MTLIGVLSWYLLQISPVKGFIVLICSFAFLSFLSFYHSQFKKKRDKWSLAAESYRMDRARLLREYNTFFPHCLHGTKEVSAAVPKGHVWASDLDIKDSLFPLLDTCGTHQGSRKLLYLLLGEFKGSLTGRSRARRSQTLSQKSPLLQKLSIHSLSPVVRETWLQEQEKASRQDQRNLIIYMFLILKKLSYYFCSCWR